MRGSPFLTRVPPTLICLSVACWPQIPVAIRCYEGRVCGLLWNQTPPDDGLAATDRDSSALCVDLRSRFRRGRLDAGYTLSLVLLGDRRGIQTTPAATSAHYLNTCCCALWQTGGAPDRETACRRLGIGAVIGCNLVVLPRRRDCAPGRCGCQRGIGGTERLTAVL